MWNDEVHADTGPVNPTPSPNNHLQPLYITDAQLTMVVADVTGLDSLDEFLHPTGDSTRRHPWNDL
jgi:hypothetical protein